MQRVLSLLIAIILGWPILAPYDGWPGAAGLAEAASQSSIRLTEREMKRDRSFTRSDLYERAHRLIYGNNGRYGPDGRPTIAVVINGDENIIVEERIKNEIYSMLRQKFPREDFAVMKGNTVNTKLLQYAEDSYYDERGTASVADSQQSSSRSVAISPLGATVQSGEGSITGSLGFPALVNSSARTESGRSKADRLDVDGLPVGMQPRGIADLRRHEFVKAGAECGYDYLFIVTLSNGQSRSYGHNYVLYNSTTNYKNVWLRVRFVDVRSGDYLYRNDIVMQGKTHNGYINGRVMQRSVHKAMQEAMDDIEIY